MSPPPGRYTLEGLRVFPFNQTFTSLFGSLRMPLIPSPDPKGPRHSARAPHRHRQRFPGATAALSATNRTLSSRSVASMDAGGSVRGGGAGGGGGGGTKSPLVSARHRHLPVIAPPAALTAGRSPHGSATDRSHHRL